MAEDVNGRRVPAPTPLQGRPANQVATTTNPMAQES